MTESTASARESAFRAFLVPTAAGAWYAASTDNDDVRREVLLALLRGACGFPVSPGWFAAWTRLRERKAIAGMLFALQREGLLTGDAVPLMPLHGPVSALLGALLERIGNGGEIVLADPSGLCVAYAGLSQEKAEQQAARVAALDPRLRRLATDGEGWSLGGDGSGPRLAVRPLHLPPHRFLLVSGHSADFAGVDFVQFISVLARYCLGAITAPDTEVPTSP
jgi:hypothetical protein